MSAASHPVVDPVELTRDLIRRPSVTPADEGAMDMVERLLTGLGFHCRRMAFENIENLYARRGTASPNLCFAGHTDVVPTGSPAAWSAAPFEAEVRDGVLYGRGAVDMKGGIAAWIAAVSRVLAEGDVPCRAGPSSSPVIRKLSEPGTSPSASTRETAAIQAAMPPFMSTAPRP